MALNTRDRPAQCASGRRPSFKLHLETIVTQQTNLPRDRQLLRALRRRVMTVHQEFLNFNGERNTATLPPTKMAPDTGSLQREINLPNTVIFPVRRSVLIPSRTKVSEDGIAICPPGAFKIQPCARRAPGPGTLPRASCRAAGSCSDPGRAPPLVQLSRRSWKAQRKNPGCPLWDPPRKVANFEWVKWKRPKGMAGSHQEKRREKL